MPCRSASTSWKKRNDRQSDQIAQVKSNVPSWVPNFTWIGDFRYRNETIDQEYVRKNRNRDRLRLRAGFVAKVNDTVKVTDAAGLQRAGRRPPAMVVTPRSSTRR